MSSGARPADAVRTGYAAVLGRPAEQLELRRGQSADVVIDRERNEVWRFPRTPDALARMAADVERLRAARDGGLPAPAVIEVAGGPAGTARVRMSRLAGTPLADSAPLGADAVARLANDIAAALEALRRLPLGRGTDHSDRGGGWHLLAVEATELLLPRLPAAGRESVVGELERARSVAATAPITAVHGDLGAAHLFVDPPSGRLLGIADWDTLAPGDPVIDVAALRATLPPEVWAALLAVRPLTGDEQARMDAYAATFALQDALLSARAGDWDAADQALSRYR